VCLKGNGRGEVDGRGGGVVIGKEKVFELQN